MSELPSYLGNMGDEELLATMVQLHESMDYLEGRVYGATDKQDGTQLLKEFEECVNQYERVVKIALERGIVA